MQAIKTWIRKKKNFVLYSMQCWEFNAIHFDEIIYNYNY